MNKGQIILQDVFLNLVRKDKINVVILLLSGIEVKGFVKGFDSFTIIFETEGKQMLIYKHAVCAITPARPVMMSN